MKIKAMKAIVFVLSLFILTDACFAAPGIKITQPQDNSIVNPGQEITITIEAVEGFVPKLIRLAVGSFFYHEFPSLPVNANVKIPEESSGQIPIMVVAATAPNNIASKEIYLKVQQTATLQSLEIDQEKVWIGLDWDGNIKEDRSGGGITTVYGIYSDGVTREIPEEEITYTSSAPSIISIDNKGNYQIHKVGEASIIVSSSGVSKVIPVIFDKPGGIRPSETIPPTATIDIQPPANGAGWHNNDITITLTAQDNEGGSGIREIIYSFPYISSESNFVKNDQAIIPFSTEGINLFRYGVSDKAGNNIGQKSLEVRLDKTPPTITSAISSKSNQAGWYNSDVTVTFNATDSLSGVKSVTSPVTVSTEGAKQSIMGEAIDIADNKATTSVTLNIDKTPPQISLELKSINLSKKEKEKGKEEDEGSWYELIYSAKDNLSGLKDLQAGLAIIDLSGFKQELEVDNEVEIEIDEKKKELKIEAPNPQSVLDDLKDALFNLNTNQVLQLKIKQGEPKWKLKQKPQGFEIQVPSIIFKAIATDIADNIATKELEFTKDKKKDKD